MYVVGDIDGFLRSLHTNLGGPGGDDYRQEGPFNLHTVKADLFRPMHKELASRNHFLFSKVCIASRMLLTRW